MHLCPPGHKKVVFFCIAGYLSACSMPAHDDSNPLIRLPAAQASSSSGMSISGTNVDDLDMESFESAFLSLPCIPFVSSELQALLAGSIASNLVEYTASFMPISEGTITTARLYEQRTSEGCETTQYDGPIAAAIARGRGALAIMPYRDYMVKNRDILNDRLALITEAIAPLLDAHEKRKLDEIILWTPMFDLSDKPAVGYDVSYKHTKGHTSEIKKYLIFMPASENTYISMLSRAEVMIYFQDLNIRGWPKSDLDRYLQHIMGVLKQNSKIYFSRQGGSIAHFPIWKGISVSRMNELSAQTEWGAAMQYLTQEFKSQITSFMILHEIAHHILSHSNQPDLSIDERELQADAWATKMMRSGGLGRPDAYSLVFWRIEHLKRSGVLVQGGYPSNEERVQNVFDVYYNQMSKVPEPYGFTTIDEHDETSWIKRIRNVSSIYQKDSE